MRYCIPAILMLFIFCNIAVADDYIQLSMVNQDSVYQNSDLDLDFYLTYECPEPNPMNGVSLAFILYTTGDVTFSHTSGEFTLHHSTDWFNVGGLIFDDTPITGTDLDTGTITFGGAYNSLFPGDGCIPPVTDELFVTIEFTIDDGFGGEFCIDSGFVPPGGTWKFSGMECGEGGAPDRPLLLDGNGDDVHPICINVIERACTGPTINVTPAGDVITRSHCSSASFQFQADPGMFGPDPVTIDAWSVKSGLGSISSSGYYTISAQSTGTYPVEIEVTNSCGNADTYAFDVEFTNNDPSFVGCPIEGHAVIESQASLQLNADDSDQCDDLEFSLVDDGGQTGVSVSAGGQFLWDPTPSTEGTYTFIAGVEDGEGGYAECVIDIIVSETPYFICGDANGNESVDIGDVLYILQYVYMGGPEPEPLQAANVNCDGVTDIDDVVYLLNYLFQGGIAPCDPDGNGIPDC